MTTTIKAHPAKPRKNFFWHPNLRHLRAITRRFSTSATDDFALVQRAVPMPAFLKFAGYPLAERQFCFKHKGHTGRALRISPQGNTYQTWRFFCVECDNRGDVSEFWFQLVQLAGRAPALWDRNYAAGDLLARLKSGQIDPTITTLPDSCHSAGPSALRARLPETPFICEMRANLKTLKSMSALPFTIRPRRLPKPVCLSAHETIGGLFPHDGWLLITPDVDRQSHYIKRRDDWLRRTPAQLASNSYISTSYLARADVNSSYAAFDSRRWLVIEDDSGSPLEQQFAIYLALADLGAPLRCVCYSGSKSLHAWFLVEGWPEHKCFELFAAAIGLGIVSDCNTYAVRQPARLPGGWNSKTRQRQTIHLWNL